MAAAAIPVAASMAAPAVASAAAPMLAGTALSGLISSAPWLLPAVTGAGMGGIGALLTGQNPLRGAALGGIGGGISSQLGGLFDTGGNAAADIASDGLPVGKLLEGTAAENSFLANASNASGITANAGNAGEGLFSSGIGKFLPYAAAGAAPLLAGTNTTPAGPPMRQGLQSKPVLPGNRQLQAVDPNSYLTSGGNRSFFSDINPQVQYAPGYAKGGRARFADGGSSSASSSNVPMGIGRSIRGPGDGKSDSIPAKLSDGEFVISAPVVSALGNGSNDAGAKKLAKMQHKVIARHYKGGSPKKALGLGAYVH